jgi:hypothetical protein
MTKFRSLIGVDRRRRSALRWSPRDVILPEVVFCECKNGTNLSMEWLHLVWNGRWQRLAFRKKRHRSVWKN